MMLATIPKCAKQLKISESRLRRAVSSGELPSMELGNRQLVDIDEANEVLCKSKCVKIGTVMEQTGLTNTAIRRAVKEGWMPCDQSGKAYLFDMDAVNAAIQRRMQEQKTEE